MKFGEKNIGKLDKSFIFKKCKQLFDQKYGSDKSNAVWSVVNEELDHLLQENKNIGSDEKMMVLPLCALYTAMKKWGWMMHLMY